MKFRVTIRKDGVLDEVKTIEAVNRFAVYDQVRGEGGYVVSIAEKHDLSLSSIVHKLNLTIGTGIKQIEIVQMAKNIAVMLSAGLSLSRALSILERQSSNKNFKKIANSLFEEVKKGAAFHEALAQHPKVFPDLYIAMAKAGEESGSLANSLSVVGLQMERSAELKRKIKGAMIYPAIVITAIIIVAILMLIYVVPTLTKTFASLGVELPLATRIIVALSDLIVENLTLFLAGLVVLVVGGITFVRSKTGRRLVLKGSLYVPVIKELVRETFSARAARTLSSLLSGGVPVLESLGITREVVRAEAFANVIREAEDHVKRGEPLSKAFIDHNELYPILLGDMISVGEETGKVAEMLQQIAMYYEGDVADKTKDLSTIVEPLLMLLIGGVVGIFAVSMISPIYSLSSAI